MLLYKVWLTRCKWHFDSLFNGGSGLKFEAALIPQLKEREIEEAYILHTSQKSEYGGLLSL